MINNRPKSQPKIFLKNKMKKTRVMQLIMMKILRILTNSRQKARKKKRNHQSKTKIKKTLFPRMKMLIMKIPLKNKKRKVILIKMIAMISKIRFPENKNKKRLITTKNRNFQNPLPKKKIKNLKI